MFLERSFQSLYFCEVDKKEQIMVAAMKLLVANGVQATPMSAIAKEAGTGMGTIYNYFDTKEALINAIYLYVKRSEMEEVLKNLNPNSSLKSRFLNFYTAFVNFHLKYPESFAFMDQMHNAPIILQETRDEGKAVFYPIIELIKQGQREDIIKQVDLELILFFLAGTVTNYVRWLLTAGKWTGHEQLMRQQLQLVWDAIKA